MIWVIRAQMNILLSFMPTQYMYNNHELFFFFKKRILVKKHGFTKINKRYINKKIILDLKNICYILILNDLLF
jgi:hypothetical protein